VLHWRHDWNAESTIMSTTTVRLPDDLKKRLADVAERAGMTSHALILKAISDRVEADEARNRLLTRQIGATLRSPKRDRPSPGRRCGATSSAGSPAKPPNHPRPAPWRSKAVARIEVAPEVAGDLDRIVDHLRSTMPRASMNESRG
jgi:hypothetical protein